MPLRASTLRAWPRAASLLAGAGAVCVLAACGSSSSGGSSGPVNPNQADVSPAGDIPDNQAYVPYRPPGGGYTVKVPEGWSRSAQGGVVTFTDKLNSVQIQSLQASSPPTSASARRADLRRLAASVKGFSAPHVSTVSRPAGKAVLITYTAAGQPNPVTGAQKPDAVERYAFFHHGRQVVLTLSGPKGADNVDPWRIVTSSVRWKG